jgi:HEAT repeat protein
LKYEIQNTKSQVSSLNSAFGIRIMLKNKLLLIVTVLALAATSVASQAQEAKLLAVLRSEATLEQKSAACRELARVGTKEAVPTLASLLGDEKLSHMARYALETIRDPSVDDALRTALGKVQGRPRLGVIGSLGVRRDAKAVKALAALLKSADTDLVQAAARALGNIGTPEAAKALESALPGTSGGNQLAICEGLLRAAEAMRSDGQAVTVRAIYDRLRSMENAPPQVRAAALRGAILVRGKEGAPLLVEAIRGSDRALTAAALRAASELPGPEITDVLVAELPKAPAERRGLLILALADRGDPRVLPAVLQAAQSGDGQLRIIALRALKRVGDASCAPALLDAAAHGSGDVSQAAIEAIESLQGKAVDEQIAARLAQAKGKSRIVLMELARRRHTAAAAPALWLAVDDKDPAVRAAALAGLGAIIRPAETDRPACDYEGRTGGGSLGQGVARGQPPLARSRRRRGEACRGPAHRGRTAQGQASGDAQHGWRSEVAGSRRRGRPIQRRRTSQRGLPRVGPVDVNRRGPRFARLVQDGRRRAAQSRRDPWIRSHRSAVRHARQPAGGHVPHGSGNGPAR